MMEKGRLLYGALAAGDTAALHKLLHERFQGHLTDGLPNGFGGRYDGLPRMMDAWGGADTWFDMAPRVDRFFEGGKVLIAQGHYVGTAKPTGKPVRAAFAHFWDFDGERFTSVRQVTDSGAWRDALQT
jgi:ketosteroid isomerase-like protein